jgi:carbon storage regulator CsrA
MELARTFLLRRVSMLTLSRKEGQSIVIDDKIKITVHRIGKGRVGLAIQAPAEVPIWRAELPPREKLEGKGAA